MQKQIAEPLLGMEQMTEVLRLVEFHLNDEAATLEAGGDKNAIVVSLDIAEEEPMVTIWHRNTRIVPPEGRTVYVVEDGNVH